MMDPLWRCPEASLRLRRSRAWREAISSGWESAIGTNLPPCHGVNVDAETDQDLAWHLELRLQWSRRSCTGRSGAKTVSLSYVTVRGIPYENRCGDGAPNDPSVPISISRWGRTVEYKKSTPAG